MLHARIVAALEELYADRLAEQVDRLAHHALRGEVWDKAVAYCRQAGTRALTHSAYHEAVTYFEQALGALQHLPERPDTQAQAIDLRLDLRSALWPWASLSGPSSTCRTPPPSPRPWAISTGWGGSLPICSPILRRQADRALASGQRALAIAADLGRGWPQGRGAALPGVCLPQPGRLSPGGGVLRRTWRISTASGSMSASACLVWPPCSPAASSPSPCRVRRLRRGRLAQRKGCGLPRSPITPSAGS